MLLFNLPDTLYNKKLSSVKLSIHTDGQLMGGELSIIPLSKQWDISGINYNDLLGDSIAIARQYVLGIQGEVDIDVTDFFESIIENEEQFYGFILSFDKHIQFFDKSDERMLLSERSLRENKRTDYYDCDTLKLYKKGDHGFSLGDVILHHIQVFKCKSVWCNTPGYTPGTEIGKMAWDECGTCIPRELNISSIGPDVNMSPKLVFTLDANISNVKQEAKNHSNLIKHSNGQLNLSKDYLGTRFVITNINGSVVKNGTVQAGGINMNSLANGTYSLILPQLNISYFFVKY